MVSHISAHLFMSLWVVFSFCFGYLVNGSHHHSYKSILTPFSLTHLRHNRHHYHHRMMNSHIEQSVWWNRRGSCFDNNEYSMSATTMMTDSQCSVIWWYELLNIYYCNAINLYNNYQTCNTLSTPVRCWAIRPLAWRDEMCRFDAFNVPSKIEGERCVIFCHYQSDKC